MKSSSGNALEKSLRSSEHYKGAVKDLVREGGSNRIR